MKKICKVCGNERYTLSWEDTCYTCERKKYINDLKQDILSNERYETSCEDEIICPWCGEVQEYDGENYETYEEGEHIIECQCCDRKFKLTTNVSYSYDTKRA